MTTDTILQEIGVERVAALAVAAVEALDRKN